MDFANKAKAIIKSCGSKIDCYHEAYLTNNGNELSAQVYYAPKDKIIAFTYTPELAPCMKVVENGDVVIKSSVQDLYPEDKGLAEIHAQSYVGIKHKRAICAVLGPDKLNEKECSIILKALKQITIFE